MIGDTDDIIQIIRDISCQFQNTKQSEISEQYLILKDNNLNREFFKLANEDGYLPDCFRWYYFKKYLSLNNIKFIIRTQQIISNKIDGEIPNGVSSEIVYNNMNDAC